MLGPSLPSEGQTCPSEGQTSLQDKLGLQKGKLGLLLAEGPSVRAFLLDLVCPSVSLVCLLLACWPSSVSLVCPFC